MAIFVDGHVHIYSQFPVGDLLDAAVKNFARAATRAGFGDGHFDGVLCLAESYGENAFRELCLKQSDGEWRFSPVDTFCLCAENRAGKKLYLMAGRQLESNERLEVLSLLQPVEVKKRALPLSELVNTVSREGGIPVIPWGVGKWSGKRRSVLEGYLNLTDTPFFLLADNGNRPSFWHFPSLPGHDLDKKGLLSGSDPLPLGGQHRRAGSFGVFWPEGRLNRENVTESLRALITEKSLELETYGKPRNFLAFWYEQLTINLGNRLFKNQTFQ